MTQKNLEMMKEKAKAQADMRNEQLATTIEERDRAVEKAECMKTIAEFTQMVSEVLAGDDRVVDERSKNIIAIVFNPNDRGWNLFCSNWQRGGTLPMSVFSFNDANKVLESVKADFDAVGIGTYDEGIYGGELIALKAFIKEK